MPQKQLLASVLFATGIGMFYMAIKSDDLSQVAISTRSTPRKPQVADTQDQGLVPNSKMISIDFPESTTAKLVEIPLTNQSSKPIRIVGVESSCGCTTAGDLPQTPVHPGSTVQLPVKIDPPGLGTTSILLTVTTDSPTHPKTPIHIEARGRTIDAPRVLHAPRPIRLTATRLGEPVAEDVSLQTVERSEAKPWITSIRSTDPALNCELTAPPDEEPQVPGYSFRTYHLRISAVINVDALTTADIEFITQPPNVKPPHPITVQLFGKSPVRAVPSVITVSERELSAKTVRQVLLYLEGDETWPEELEITDVPTGLSVSSENSSTDPRARSFQVTMDRRLVQTAAETGNQQVSLKLPTGLDTPSLVEVAVKLVP